MNPALSLLAASIVLAPQTPTTPATSSIAAAPALERTYKVGDELNYVLSMSSGTQAMHIGAKIHVKTVALADGGKASQELTATEFSGGPDGAGDPEKVTWTFAKDGMAAADFDVQSGRAVYSLLSIVSVLPGSTQPGKEFKINWTSPDKASTVTGTGTYEGIKDVSGKKVAVVKTTLEVSPSGQTATLHNTSTFDPLTGKLMSADGTVDVQGMQLTLTVKTG